MKFVEVMDTYIDFLCEKLPDELRGPWLKSTDMETKKKNPGSSQGSSSPCSSSTKKLKIQRSVNDLVVADADEAKTIIRSLKQIGKKYVSVDMDGNCLLNAYLSNIIVPDEYDVTKFRKQLAAFSLKNYNLFRNKIHTPGESYESYMRNLAQGRSYGDRHCLEMATMMWSTRVSIINPHFETIHIWHDQELEDSHIVLAWNGNDHYVGSCFKETPHLRLRSLDNVVLRKNAPKVVQGVRSFLVPIKQEDVEHVKVSENVEAKTVCENVETKTTGENVKAHTICENVQAKTSDEKIDAKSCDDSVHTGCKTDENDTKLDGCKTDENGNINMSVSASQKQNPPNNDTVVESSTVDISLGESGAVDSSVTSSITSTVQVESSSMLQGPEVVGSNVVDSTSSSSVVKDVDADISLGGDEARVDSSSSSSSKENVSESIDMSNPPTPDFRTEHDDDDKYEMSPKKLVPYYSDISDESVVGTTAEKTTEHDENLTETNQGDETPEHDENLTETNRGNKTPEHDENLSDTSQGNKTAEHDEKMTDTQGNKTPTHDENPIDEQRPAGYGNTGHEIVAPTCSEDTKTDSTKLVGTDEVLNLVDSCITDSASKKNKQARKREKHLTPTSPCSSSTSSKKAKITAELDKFKNISNDLASLEKYVKKAKKFQNKLRSNLLEMGVRRKN